MAKVDAIVQAVVDVPDVVLLDINLPNMNGLQVASQLKADHNRTGIVLLTAYDDDEQILHAMRAGASAYCVSPGAALTRCDPAVIQLCSRLSMACTPTGSECPVRYCNSSGCASL